MSRAPLKKPPTKEIKGYGTAGHALGWLAVLALVFSGTTITLAAMAQSTGSTECTRSSYANLRCLSRDLGGFMDTVNTKFDRALALTEQCTNSDAGCRATAVAGGATEDSAGEQRVDSTTTPPPQDTPPPPQPVQVAPPNSPPPVQEPPPATTQPNPQPTPPPNPPPNPQPNPQKAANLQTCLQQCANHLNHCVEATTQTPVTTGYKGNDPICNWNHDNECIPLCNDWYNSPVVTKPPVPPIESQAQTCLLGCRTQMSLCFKAAKITYQVTNPQIPPPQAYFDELSNCAIEKDNTCRAQCRAWNPSSTLPTK